MLLPLMGKRLPIDLNFMNGYLPSGVSFSRASTKRAFNSSGILAEVATGIPAFEYDPVTLALRGLLYEPQRTNKQDRSWRIGSWSNNSATSTTNSVYVSPDGTQNASEIVTAENSQGRYKSVSSLTAGAHYAVSGFVKVLSGVTRIRTGVDKSEGSGSINAYVDIEVSDGSVPAKGAAVYDLTTTVLPSGWIYFRYRVVMGAAQTTTSFLAYSIGGGATFSVWGAQVEELTVAAESASSPIYTDGSAATRATDQLSFDVPSSVTALQYTFFGGTTQRDPTIAGAYVAPTNLSNAYIQRISDSKAVLDLSFLGAQVPTEFTFSRASTKRAFNSSGVLAEVATGIPAFEYDPVTLALRGLLYEPQKQNPLSRSVLGTGWSPVGGSIGTSAGTAPDGTSDLSSFSEDTGTSAHWVAPIGWPSFVSGTLYTFSAYAKKNTAKILQLSLATAAFSSTTYANFNLDTGVVTETGAGCSASIEYVGSGFYRCSITATASATLSERVFLGLTNDVPVSGLRPSYTGKSKGVFAWGIQVEQGPTPSSYIPTAGSVVTRATDALSITIPSSVSRILYVFNDGTKQSFNVSPGAYSVPTNLNKPRLGRTILA